MPNNTKMPPQKLSGTEQSQQQRERMSFQPPPNFHIAQEFQLFRGARWCTRRNITARGYSTLKYTQKGTKSMSTVFISTSTIVIEMCMSADIAKKAVHAWNKLKLHEPSKTIGILDNLKLHKWLETFSRVNKPKSYWILMAALLNNTYLHCILRGDAISRLKPLKYKRSMEIACA